MEYLVSIIIPVYKVEAYIERCLTSVMCQTYHNSAIECIIVDDCSPDKSIAIAQNMINSYHGNIDFKIIRNEKNGGLSVARNNGMKYATGKYIFFLDSDDHIQEDCMKILLSALDIHPNAEMVMGNSLNMKDNTPFIQVNTNNQLITYDNSQLLSAFYMEVIPTMVWNSLILREIIVKNQLSFKPKLVHEDKLWASKLYPLINSFVYVPQITLIYENNPSSIINSVGVQPSKDLPHCIVIMEELLKSFNEAHFVEYTLLLCSSLINMLDMSSHCGEDMKIKVKRQRNQLMINSIRHGRIVLVLFELLMYNPLFQLFRSKLIRLNFYRLKKITYFIASFFNCLHGKKYPSTNNKMVS